MNQTTDTATVDRHVWATLRNSLYPGAKDESIRMVLSYCKARGLDPMKKPCHIVPMYVNKVDGQGKEWRDVIFPGIYELRTTAQSTGDYMGQDKATFSDDFDFLGESVPVSCEVKVHRWHEKSSTKISYGAEVFFVECAGTKTDDQGVITLNARWQKAPRQMIEKCAEAAALRKAFPDELGGQMAAEEMHGATMLEAPQPGAKPATATPQSKAKAATETAPARTESDAPAEDSENKHCSKAQGKLVTKRLDESGIPESDFLRHFGIDHIDFLLAAKVDEALEWMKELTEPPQ